jgi:hypothetical protein
MFFSPAWSRLILDHPKRTGIRKESIGRAPEFGAEVIRNAVVCMVNIIYIICIKYV